MNHPFDGKTALVTGSTSGIGHATALQLGSQGARVLVVGRSEERGAAVVAEIIAAGGAADFLAADLTTAGGAKDLAARALALTGGIDILINNAGGGLFGPTVEVSEEDWDGVFGSNVKSAFFLVAALAPTLGRNKSGAIVNVTTMASQFGMPGMAVYGASKAALAHLTKVWAAEFAADGVRVNAVSPGPTRTRGVEGMGDSLDQLAAQGPLVRVGTPEEIAAAIVFLASDASAFTTGAILNVDGGRTAI